MQIFDLAVDTVLVCYCTDIDENIKRHGGDKKYAFPIHADVSVPNNCLISALWIARSAASFLLPILVYLSYPAYFSLQPDFLKVQDKLDSKKEKKNKKNNSVISHTPNIQPSPLVQQHHGGPVMHHGPSI